MFTIVFIKAPAYTSGFLVIFLLFLVSLTIDRGFGGFFCLCLSCLFWCFFSLVEFIADNRIHTMLMGYNLKEVVPISRGFLGLSFVFLFLGWFFILFGNNSNIFMAMMMFLSIPCFIIGSSVVQSMILIGIAQNMDEKESFDTDKLLKDIIKLLAQK